MNTLEVNVVIFIKKNLTKKKEMGIVNPESRYIQSNEMKTKLVGLSNFSF